MADTRRDLAECLAEECRNAAARLMRLQETLGRAMARIEISEPLVEDLQSLDTVAQTMEDLGSVLGALSASGEDIGQARDLSEAVLSSISQTSLRLRLMGRADPVGNDGIDLF